MSSGLCYKESTVQNELAVAEKTSVCGMECLKAADNDLDAHIEKEIIHDA